MKFSNILMILGTLFMVDAMGAAAADNDEDPWVTRMMREHKCREDKRLLLQEVKVSNRIWLEESIVSYAANPYQGRLEHLLKLAGTLDGPPWFNTIVNQLDPCSQENLEAFLTMPSNMRKWARNMTGLLMTDDFKGDLKNWGLLLRELSAPYLDKYGPKSRQRIGWRLDKIFQKFRNGIKEQGMPEVLDMDYFKSLLSSGNTSVSASEGESDLELD